MYDGTAPSSGAILGAPLAPTNKKTSKFNAQLALFAANKVQITCTF